MTAARTHPHTGQVVTVFRNRLREESRDAYVDELAVVADLARSMPGFVETKTFVADDGERATVVTFADPESHRAWRDHPRHRQAQRTGISDYYAEYSIAVGTTSYASAFHCDDPVTEGSVADDAVADDADVTVTPVGASVPILGAMGVRVVESGPGRVVAELPAEPNRNHFGVAYAGSLYSVAEMLGGVLARATFDLEGELAGCVPLVKESTIRFRRPALGVVRAEATLSPDEVDRVRREALASGKGEFVLEATLTDAAGEVVATTIGTYQVRRLG